jgi:hypothetical protein
MAAPISVYPVKAAVCPQLSGISSQIEVAVARATSLRTIPERNALGLWTIGLAGRVRF